MGLAIIMISNLLLVQVNSSDSELAYKTLIKLKKDKVMWAVGIGTILGLVIILYTPLSEFLELAPLGLSEMLKVCGISIVSILWYEGVKIFKK